MTNNERNTNTLGGARSALAGLKVLDASRLLPAALCTQMLGDLGADILKVEEPGRGDYQRSFPPIGKVDSGTFLLCNRNKRSMTLNLKHEDGKRIFRELAAQSDVVVEGFRPGVMDRLGLGYDAVRGDRTDLIYVSLSGFGPTGPYATKGAYDTVIQAYGGLGASQADIETGE
jgi:crotonobetainyl-CoA:carnitine CoA-transferase CaiB-like acyl-CoA transferase